MLYPKSKEDRLAPQVFQNPGAEYRGTPFWSWNTAVTDDLVKEQIDVFRRMGFGGFHIHARTGLATPYLGEEFLRLVQVADEAAKRQNMLCWLYDEDRFPSGAAGGLVTKDLSLRSRWLVLGRGPAGGAGWCQSKAAYEAAFAAGEQPKGYYIASYRVKLENGHLASYSRTGPDAADGPEGLVWHAHMVLMAESPWYNGQTYLDCMNPAAAQRFVQETHERYYKALGTEFGKSVPAIFTDEPHVKGKQTLPFAESRQDVTLSYTDDFSATFAAAYGYDILDYLPELLWELPRGEASVHRWRYHNHVAERFASAFCDTLGDWCEKHGIALTGHFLSERTLYSQTLALGEAMRGYRAFQLPGIDILANQMEFSTAKQAVSVARQDGREGVLSELYGVTHWDADFKLYKLQGDWQAALGVTIRVPHLAYMSMEGEAKRDWPASISYQSPWFEDYAMVENHFSRLNTALTRGQAHCRVGVIQPVESFWLAFGPNDQTQDARDQLDSNYENLMQWLLYGLIDFDLISESLLPSQCPAGGAPLQVGQCAYDAILVPGCRTLRVGTLQRLEAFANAGGLLIFAGGAPELVDARPSHRAAELAKRAVQTPFTREGLLAALQPCREISLRTPAGKLSDNLFYQMRQDGAGRWLFLCHVNRKANKNTVPEQYEMAIKGEWALTVYDTATGQTRPAPALAQNGQTRLPLALYAEDSLLLRLEPLAPAQAVNAAKAPQTLWVQPPLPAGTPLVFTAPQATALTEPNALLLDVARASLDGGDFGPPTDILKLDNVIRRRLGYPGREDHFIQPWAQPEEKAEHRVELRFTFLSEIEAEGCLLAVERPQDAEITLNGEAAGASCGWYVDKFIRTVPLPRVQKGENTLCLRLPFGKKTNLETLFILGDFGVVEAPAPTIVPRRERLGFGDIARQGLPFYTGNVRYQFSFTMEKPGTLTVAVPHFSAPVLRVNVDGKDVGHIAYAPHRLAVPGLSKGEHRLEICLCNSRFNGFGTLHNSNSEYKWYNSNAYRTTGDEWTEGYWLRPVGILSRVELYTE